MSPLGILFGAPGKPPFRRRVPLVLTGLTAGTIRWGSSLFTGVNRGGGGGGFGFLRTVRIADGCAGGLMRGAFLACSLIFSMLEAVVLLELLFRVSVLELSVISSSSCRSEVRVSIWSTTSLSSLATSFRSPRTSSRSSTMILICSFTLVLEPAGGPSAREDEEGVPLDLEDILWGHARAGQRRRASGGCCAPPSLALLRPLPPRSPNILDALGAAAAAAAGDCARRSAPRPRRGAAINSPRRGARRGAADGRAARLRLRPPPAHTRACSPPRVGMRPRRPPLSAAAPAAAALPSGVSPRTPGPQRAGRQVPALPTPASRS